MNVKILKTIICENEIETNKIATLIDKEKIPYIETTISGISNKTAKELLDNNKTERVSFSIHNPLWYIDARKECDTFNMLSNIKIKNRPLSNLINTKDKQKLMECMIIPHQFFGSKESDENKLNDNITEHMKCSLNVKSIDLNDENQRLIFNHFKIQLLEHRFDSKRHRVSDYIAQCIADHYTSNNKKIKDRKIAFIFIEITDNNQYKNNFYWFTHIRKNRQDIHTYGDLKYIINNCYSSSKIKEQYKRDSTCKWAEKFNNDYMSDNSSYDFTVNCSDVFNTITHIITPPKTVKIYGKVNTPIDKNDSDLKERLEKLKAELRTKHKRPARGFTIANNDKILAKAKAAEARIRAVNTSMAARIAA